MHEVTVSTLPHPVSMFFLGAMVLGIIILWREYVSLQARFKESKQLIDKMMDKIDLHNQQVDDRIESISKKIDSRVDKALMAIKK